MLALFPYTTLFRSRDWPGRPILRRRGYGEPEQRHRNRVRRFARPSLPLRIQSRLIPAALIGPAHFSTSLATNLARYSGDVRSGATSVEPSSCMRSCSAFVFIASITAALSLLTIGAGVPFG